MSLQQTYIDNDRCTVVRDNDKIIKTFKIDRKELDDEWSLHYQRFNDQYNILPVLYDFEPGKKLVMEYIEGTPIRENSQMVVTITRFMNYFAEYSHKSKVDFYHGDMTERNLIDTESGVKLVDIDSITVNDMLNSNTAFIKAYYQVSRYILKDPFDIYR